MILFSFHAGFKNYLLLLALLVVSLLVPASGLAAPQIQPSGKMVEGIPVGDATVFIYHHFGDDRYPTTNVDLEKFNRQMSYLQENGYKVVPLAELVAQLKSKKPLESKTVAITIDDGYRTIYTNAWPILKKYKYPFTVFLYAEGIEKGYKNYLTWEQVKEMRLAGVDFQDHSYSHNRLADWPKGMSEKEYRQWIHTDLVHSVTVLKEKLGKNPVFFALPYGEYNRLVMEEARAIGYEAIFTQNPGSVSDQTDVYAIPREPILGKEWSSLKHFEKILERVDLPLADMKPNIEPVRGIPEVFGARLLDPNRYVPGSFGIYVSELGWLPARLDGDFLYIRNQKPLHRRLNRVMISARERESGRTAVRFWLLLKPEK